MQIRPAISMALTFILLSLFITPFKAHAVTNPICTEQSIDVSLASDQPLTENIVGDLCDQRATQYFGDNLVIFVHGATANRNYWDLPYNNSQYSVVRQALNWGFSVYNMDSIGSGHSSKPDGTLVTVDAAAYTLKQVTDNFRDDYDKIVVVGHSFGSLYVAAAASTYPDLADGIALTGYAHDFTPEAAASNSFWPAVADPAFQGQTLPNYLTTIPGTRAASSFYSPLIDPGLVAYDEQTKDVVPVGLLEVPRLFSNETTNITADVLVLNGAEDFIFCGNSIDCSDEDNLQAYESQFFTNAASFDARTLNVAGHALNLHYHGQAATSILLSWVQGVFI